MNKLVKAGASILAKIPIGPKKIPGTVVDFCYDLFYQVTLNIFLQYENINHFSLLFDSSSKS